MSAHKAPYDLHSPAVHMVDPGASGTITADRNPCYVALVSATAESRTLANPTEKGVRLIVQMLTDGGDITLTVTNGYNLNGDTVITFNEATQVAIFESYNVSGTAFRWKLVWTDAAGAVRGSEVLTALSTLTAADNGKTFFLDAAAGFATTLPAPALGLKFDFYVKTALSGGSHTIVTAAAAQVLGGHVVTPEDAAADFEAPLAGTTITFVDGKSVAGDRAYVQSDGTSWYASCFASIAAGITITG